MMTYERYVELKHAAALAGMPSDEAKELFAAVDQVIAAVTVLQFTCHFWELNHGLGFPWPEVVLSQHKAAVEAARIIEPITL